MHPLSGALPLTWGAATDCSGIPSGSVYGDRTTPIGSYEILSGGSIGSIARLLSPLPGGASGSAIGRPSGNEACRGPGRSGVLGHTRSMINDVQVWK